MQKKIFDLQKKNICVVTGTRAEYGLLKLLMGLIRDSSQFNLQLIVTGTHLSVKHGATLAEIESDGFNVTKKVDISLVNDSPVCVAHSTSIGLTESAKILDDLKPDLLLVVGDRYEILSIVISAMFHRIPVAHIHGGELTQGAIDESIRHAITKFSHLHFVANSQYRNRVIQLGEQPDRVHNVGGLGVDAIQNIELLDRDILLNDLNVSLKNKVILITYHPVTLNHNSSKEEIEEIFAALESVEDATFIFTMSNADVDSEIINVMIEKFVDRVPHSYYFKSLGQLRYLSLLNVVDVVLGNSSSGLTEVPSFNKPTVNIGNRQSGRLMAKSVINCDPDSRSIRRALNVAFDPIFRASIHESTNPYGNGGASKKIFDVLCSIKFDGLVQKQFFDLFDNSGCFRLKSLAESTCND